MARPTIGGRYYDYFEAGYRGCAGPLEDMRGVSAKDVVDYEADELGNDTRTQVTKALKTLGVPYNRLAQHSFRDIVWVASSKKAAANYGDGIHMVKLPPHAVVLAEDGDDGYLVYCGKEALA